MKIYRYRTWADSHRTCLGCQWSKIKLQPSLYIHREQRVTYSFFCKCNNEKKMENPKEIMYSYSWVKQRLSSVSSLYHKWKGKNGSLGTPLKYYISANHFFFQVWKNRPRFSKRQLKILIAWSLIVIYQRIIFQVSLQWLVFFRLSSVSFGSRPYTQARSTDAHSCTVNKYGKHFSVIFLAIIFKPLKFFHFYLVIGLWLLYLSAFPWFFQSIISNLLRIFCCETLFSWNLKFSFMYI